MKLVIRKKVRKPLAPVETLASGNKIKLYSVLVMRNNFVIHGNNSGSKFMERLNYPSLPEHEKIFFNEFKRPYDVLTEFTNMTHYLKNPYVHETRYTTLEYEEIKRRDYLILSRPLPSGLMRMFKQQKVLYTLYHRSRPFPSGAMIVHSKPTDITIRYDTRLNKIRIEGPGCLPIWSKL